MKKLLDKINWKAFIINILIASAGIALSSFAIGCFYACGLGTDPISVLVDGLHKTFNLSYGTITTIFNVLWTIMIIFFLRDKLGIGVLISILLGGTFVDLFSGLMISSFPVETTALWVKILMLAGGIVCFAFATAMIIGANLGIGTWSFPPLWLMEKFKLPLKYTQMATDALWLAVGWILGGVVGIGTVAAVLLTGPFIEYSLKLLGPVFAKIGPNFKSE